MRTIYHHMVHPAPEQKGTLEQFWNSLMHSMLPNNTKVMHASYWSYQFKIEFMYYCNNIPGVFLPSTLQMKCCNVAAPAVALSTTTHYGLGKTFHNRGVTSLRAGRGRGWWGYWWNMLASGYTLHNNNIVHTHTHQLATVGADIFRVRTSSACHKCHNTFISNILIVLR